MNEFNVSLTQDELRLCKEIMNEDMLNVAVVRDVLIYCRRFYISFFGLDISFLRVLRNYMFVLNS